MAVNRRLLNQAVEFRLGQSGAALSGAVAWLDGLHRTSRLASLTLRIKLDLAE
jgi:hypothetical protein